MDEKTISWLLEEMELVINYLDTRAKLGRTITNIELCDTVAALDEIKGEIRKWEK